MLINQLEARFTSQGSQDLVKLLPLWGSFISLSDLNIKYKWHFNVYFTSDALQVIRSQMVWNWWQSAKSVFLLTSTKNPSKIQLIDASQAAKSLAQKTVLLISKKGANCVSFGDRLKLRELLRLVPWATEFEHHLAQNLGKAHLPKSMKSRSFPVESYEKLLPIKGSFISLSDLNIKYKWQFIISTLLQMFFKWSLAKWSHMNGISIRLMVISEQQKTCVCASFCSTNTIDQAKLNKSMLQRPPSHLLKRLCCYRASWGK